MSQVAKFGPWVSGWGCGTQGWREGRRVVEGGERAVHKLFMSAGAHRASNLSTLPERKAAFLSPQNSSKRLRGCSVTTITAVYPHKRFQEADVSMTFPGKLPSVLLLVLLAAQGKRSGPPPFFCAPRPGGVSKRKVCCRRLRYGDRSLFT